MLLKGPNRKEGKWTFGTGIEVCWAMKRIVDASDRCLKGPYLTQSRLERRTLPVLWAELCEQPDGGKQGKPPYRALSQKFPDCASY